MRAAFYTLGCKVNQYETEILAAQFEKSGYEIVSHEETADVYVINSCTVTSSGDKKTRQILHRFRRQNPNAIIALTGCFPQAFPEEAEKITEADIIRGAQQRMKLLDDIHAVQTGGVRIIDITPHSREEQFEKMSAAQFRQRTRAFVKIEDGCDKYCSYCIIPKARGPIRSKSLDDLASELKELATNGYKEVVLVGINLSSYGKDIDLRLIDAVELACATEGIERVRLGSLEPELLSDDDLKRLSVLDKFCPQFHLALQSGCNATLKRMNRHYTTEEYAELVAKIRLAFDNPSITTDIMVGFPGETEEEFSASLAFAKQIKLAKAHVFAYSKREGTPAAKRPDQIARAVKERRSSEMIAATAQTQQEFLQTQVGRVENVLFESKVHDYYYEGYTPNYATVWVKSETDLSGMILPVNILSAESNHCVAELHQK